MTKKLKLRARNLITNQVSCSLVLGDDFINKSDSIVSGFVEPIERDSIIEIDTGFQDSQGIDLFEGDIVYYKPEGWSMYSARDCKIEWIKNEACLRVSSLDGAFSWNLRKDFCKSNLTIKNK